MAAPCGQCIALVLTPESDALVLSAQPVPENAPHPAYIIQREKVQQAEFPPQKPGGLTRCDTLVHLGSSAERERQRRGVA